MPPNFPFKSAQKLSAECEAHTCNPSTCKGKWEEQDTEEASLGYMVSVRPAKDR